MTRAVELLEHIRSDSSLRSVDLVRAIREHVARSDDKYEAVNAIKRAIHVIAPNAGQPVDLVQWVPLEQVVANDYNPNAVARSEMTLLLRSIVHDGYTQPIVVIWNPDRTGGVCPRCLPNDGAPLGVHNPSCVLCYGTCVIQGLYEIVDGFHRYSVMKANQELRERCGGRLPVVILDKNINERMAATVRHNRARGRHSVDGMANMVFQMLENGMQDADICNELGMEAEELVRLKHITGFAKLFEQTAYNRAWVTKKQVQLKKARDAVDAKFEVGLKTQETQET